MPSFDLRPLTVGEILDRSFTLYRRNFLLFIGITAVAQVVVLALQLLQLWKSHPSRSITGASTFGSFLIFMLVLVVTLVVAQFSQAATIVAVSDLYLLRPVSLSQCLRRAWSEIAAVIGTAIRNGLAILAGLIALVIPGLYLLCRLLVSIPVTIIEQRGPRESVARSWQLTQGNAGRSAIMMLVYLAITIVLVMFVSLPVTLTIVANRGNPAAIQLWTAVNQVGNAIINTLVQPILLISTSVFYFDLRVRKEAFDLQFMMDPTSERATPSAPGTLPSILS